MPINFDLSEYAKTYNIFIETGTHKGDGVKKAMKAGFHEIYSIELDTERFTNCKKMFENDHHVTIIHGDSGTELPKLMNNIDEPCVLWLDAHYCADGAEISDKWTPIKEELDTLQNHSVNTHMILIDDYRCMDNTHIDEKTQKEVGFPGKQRLLERLKEINPDYMLEFMKGHVENDVVKAWVQHR